MTKLWTKKETQATLKALRDSGFQVEKSQSGYKAYGIDNELVLHAMIGTRGYLVQYSNGLFED